MRTQKRVSYLLAAPLFIIAAIVMQFSGISVGTASAATYTWTGSAGDGLFSTGANWNTGDAPTNGDHLTFSVTGLTSSPTYTNDISNLSVTGINIGGTPASYINPTIVGNSLTLTGNISNTVTYGGTPRSLRLNNGLILGTDVVVAGPIELGGNGKTTNVGSHTLSFTNSGETCANPVGVLAGSGAVTFAGGTGAQYSIPSASPSFSGAINVSSGLLYVLNPAGLGNASGLNVSGEGSLNFYSLTDSTWTTPLSLGGSGTLYVQHSSGDGCSGETTTDKYTATITASVTLTSDFVFNGQDNLAITGTYTDNGHSFKIENGATGSLTTPNGTIAAPVLTTDLSGDQPNTDVLVGFNETATLNGSRANISAFNGGILKGTGTAQNVFLYGGGIIAPGNSPGTLTILNSYSQSDSTYQAEILNSSSYDKLAIGANYTESTSAVTLSDGAVLTPVLYDGWKINAGDKFTIIDNLSTTPIDGTFTGLTEGAQIVVGSITFTISYVGGDGNDVVLTAVNSGVGAPNTGVQKLIMGNPIIVAVLGITAAATIFFVAVRRKSNR